MRLPIDPKAAPVRNRPVYKRVDLRHIGRPRVITREQILDNIHREPCHEAYAFDHCTGNFTLKD